MPLKVSLGESFFLAWHLVPPLFLGAVGADADLVHGQFFYASGDDGTDASETGF